MAATLKVLLLLVPLLICFSHSVFASSCGEEEREALIEFKKHLTDPGRRLSSWVGEDCCAWRGIGCDITTGRVTQINLRNVIQYNNSLEESIGDIPLGGEVSSSLLHLKHLMSLDLSYNDFNLSPVPEFLGLFQQLRYLNLSWGGFGGKIPHQLGNLSKLEYLDLSGCYLELPKTVDLPASLIELHLWYYTSTNDGTFTVSTNLTSLKVLDISATGFALSLLPKWLSGLNSLTTLVLQYGFRGTIPAWFCTLRKLKYVDMRRNSLGGRIPNCLSNLSHLAYLDLSANNFDGPILPETLSHLAHLETLNIANNQLSGIIPSNIGHLTSLQVLDLSNNHISGSIPTNFGNLCNLKELRLAVNDLNGHISSELSGTCITKSLQLLYLSYNQLKGDVPSWLTECQNLRWLTLEHNSFSGTIPSTLGRLSYLQSLSLRANNLTGSIPKSLGQLSLLEDLDVSNNNFMEAIVNEIHFTHLSRLQVLDMSSTSVVWNVSSDWSPPFQLTELYLSSCTLGPRFPTWFQKQTNLKRLDISSSSISDAVPNSFWNFSAPLYYLNVSHNRLRGQLPNLLHIDVIDLSYNSLEGSLVNFSSVASLLDMSSNLITGQIPIDISSKIPFVSGLFLSDNRITGSIPISFCQIPMQVLSLSRNQISGAIPDCWNSTGSLMSIDLSRNNLVGKIPSTLGNLSSLVSVYLSVNNLTGGLSSMLQSRLPELLVLDLGENKLVGRIPPHIGDKLPNLMILRLRSNMLFGSIPSELSLIASLQVLDLAQNNLSGGIPKSFNNFTAMKLWNKTSERNNLPLGNETSEEYYYEKVSVNIKGGEWEYRRNDITVSFLASIDLSSNKLSGEIPNALSDLVGLVSMNLSNNRLTGKIPHRIGNLQQLESLDLSKNLLYGRIPDSLSALHFLAYMNLSHNNLSGRIPQGFQIQTLDDPSIYAGNPELCGPPIRKQCQEVETPPTLLAAGGNNKKEIDDDDDNNQMLFLYISVALGFIVGLWGVFVVLLFSKSWRMAYYRFSDELEDKIIVIALIWWAKF
ncbi:hypothetical protein H6P81_012302 [Aristolochia fimbriata]|uniref:Leucine-rich repeat-containing N-terminal plant-type domain-containing protein n=1 Tax=Aristolochia fimbriata TaxID=158543 RepID=A0AAV7EBZ1_ARIFI|nr:hypothetical protein H6P81_012302 [Aristolochia fimbriata]